MGKLIVIEGVSDGIGKTTQVELLYNKLVSEGYDVLYHHFPSYGVKSAVLVEDYLKGDLGKREDIGPYAVSSFYAIDRFYVYYTKLKQDLLEGKIVLLDRYTTSNLIYQGALFDDKDKDNFMDYITDYEYNKLGLMEPSLVIFLKVDKNYSVKLLSDRFKENKTTDINERDTKFLDKVYDNSLYVASKYNFKVVDCSCDNRLRSIDDISDEIYSIVKENIN